MKNDAFTLEIEGLPPAADIVLAKVILLCEELCQNEDEDEGRQWRHVENVEWPPRADLDAR